VHNLARGHCPVPERYTRNEAVRILGVTPRQLQYWEQLQLVRPRARWGERFYNFADLVALGTIKRLTEERIPARRLRRAIAVVEREMGLPRLPLQSLELRVSGRQVAVIPPMPDGRPIEPLTGQFLLRFPRSARAPRVHRMVSRSAEEWFEFAIACDTQPETMTEAVAAYRRVIEMAPEWVEAHINLGVALYQCGELDDARRAFSTALSLEPRSSIASFNMGCVLDELGEIEEAIRYFEQAVLISPANSDAHFNLALAYEKRHDRRRARQHWSQYLRCAPSGPWAEYARSRVHPSRRNRRLSEPIPFRRNS
jgi:tetratricopeptide (TPR) repeat protein